MSKIPQKFKIFHVDLKIVSNGHFSKKNFIIFGEHHIYILNYPVKTIETRTEGEGKESGMVHEDYIDRNYR